MSESTGADDETRMEPVAISKDLASSAPDAAPDSPGGSLRGLPTELESAPEEAGPGKSPPTLGPGSMVAGRYALERELGRGGRGVVYKARDTRMASEIALKLTTVTGHAYDHFKSRFRREARIGRMLGRAPGFVRALDWGELPGENTLYLAMDLVENARDLDLSEGSLETRLERLVTAARLVAKAHSKGVVHRDLKPANFMVSSKGDILLGDFGLAKLRGQEDEPGPSPSILTQTGVAAGTPAFMPPEQFADVKNVDERADVYALGVMLFNMLTGKYPYGGTQGVASIVKEQMLVRSGKSRAPRPRDHDTTIPTALDRVCVEALALSPHDRLPAALSFMERLEKARRGQPLRQPPTGRPPVARVVEAVPPRPPSGRAPQQPGGEPGYGPAGYGPVGYGPVGYGPAGFGGRDSGRMPQGIAQLKTPSPWKRRLVGIALVGIPLLAITSPWHPNMWRAALSMGFTNKEVREFGTMFFKDRQMGLSSVGQYPPRSGGVLIVRQPITNREMGRGPYFAEDAYPPEIDRQWAMLPWSLRASEPDEVCTVIQLRIVAHVRIIYVYDIKHKERLAMFAIDDYPEFEYGSEGRIHIVDFVKRMPLREE